MAGKSADARFWKVVGGADKGGIVVRTGKQVASAEADGRLSTGALVKELEAADGRLRYELVTGAGPKTGWVTIRLKEKALLEEAPAPQETAKPTAVSGADPHTPRKVRVLCLHGTSSSPAVLKMQLRTLEGIARDTVDFVFHAGHLDCHEDDPISGPQIRALKPFFPNETFRQYAIPIRGVEGMSDGDPEKPETWRSYDKLDGALERAQDALKEHAPIDAVLGFSQGSNITSLLAAQAATGQGASLCCVVHLCTAMPGWITDKPELFRTPLPIPAYIMRGEKDRASNGADELAKLYDSQGVQRGQHSGDHRPLPSDTKESKKMAEEILDFLLRHCKISQDGLQA